MKKYKGQCYCGKIKYKIKPPIKFVVHDHCSICRRISGAAFVTWCGVKNETDQFELIEGADNLITFQSGHDSQRQFCKNCGTHLFFRSKRWVDEIHFTRASIVSDMDELVTGHVYYSDKAEWMHINDDLEKRGGESGMEVLNCKNFE